MGALPRSASFATSYDIDVELEEPTPVRFVDVGAAFDVERTVANPDLSLLEMERELCDKRSVRSESRDLAPVTLRDTAPSTRRDHAPVTLREHAPSTLRDHAPSTRRDHAPAAFRDVPARSYANLSRPDPAADSGDAFLFGSLPEPAEERARRSFPDAPGSLAPLAMDGYASASMPALTRPPAFSSYGPHSTSLNEFAIEKPPVSRGKIAAICGGLAAVAFVAVIICAKSADGGALAAGSRTDDGAHASQAALAAQPPPPAAVEIPFAAGRPAAAHAPSYDAHLDLGAADWSSRIMSKPAASARPRK